jgi:hypothetical protein
MTVNQALMPASASQGRKGQMHSGETLIGILGAWWYDPEEQCFRSLRTAGPNLDCQVAWVHHELFGGRNKKRKPIEAPPVRLCLYCKRHKQRESWCFINDDIQKATIVHQ